MIKMIVIFFTVAFLIFSFYNIGYIMGQTDALEILCPFPQASSELQDPPIQAYDHDVKG